MGCGLVFTVAPLTATVLAAIDVQRAGIGSAINNAVARIGALLAVAVLPTAAGITTLADDLGPQFATAMHLAAALATLGAAIAFLTIRHPLRSGQPIAPPRCDPVTRTVFGPPEPPGSPGIGASGFPGPPRRGSTDCRASASRSQPKRQRRMATKTQKSFRSSARRPRSSS